MSAPALIAHLSTAELGQRYRAARQPIERSHLQIVWLVSQGRSEREVAAVTGYGQRWIAEIVRRYNAGGASGLGDQRARNTGARPLLNQEDEVALRDTLAGPPADGGLWTGPKVAAWMTARLGRKVWPQRGWDYLQKLGYRSQVPRPRHAKAASAEEQEAFKRGSRAKWTSAAPRTPRGRSRSGRSTSSASV
jgi:transposase